MRLIEYWTIGITAFFAVSAPLCAAIPDNDNFATRTRLFGTNISTRGSNVDSTQEPGEPDPSFWGGKSVWWTWTAPTNGAVTITTAGSTFDTMISVFTGDTLATLNLVAFNDTETNTSSVNFNVTQNTVYQIMVDGALNAIGDISLQLTLGPTQSPPANDNFANRITLSGSHVTANANNVGATREAGEPYHADNVDLKSLWWSWTAPSSGKLTLTTQGSSIDTVVGIYTGNSVSNLTFVAGNDESALNPNGQSLVICNVTSGKAYQIAVDGFEGDTGAIKMRLDLSAADPVPPNDNFANRAVLSGTNVTVSGRNIGASFEAIGADFEQGEPMHLETFGGHSVWWTWTAPFSGGVSLTTTGLSTSGFELDTIAVVYTGNQLGTLQFVAGNDEDFLTSAEGDSRVRFNAIAGTAYQIAVDGYDADVGTFTLHLFMEPALPIPTNDNFANRISISGTNINVLGANRGATFEPGEPLPNNSYGGKSIWWTWTSPGPGFVTMDTVSSSNSFPDTFFDTIIAVYTGSTLSTLIPVASDDESGGNYLSVVKFPTRSGVTYQIDVDSYDGDLGDVNLHVAFTSASYNLSVSTNPTAGGSVTISPAPNEGMNYAPGTVVTLTATPGSGATFTGWSGSISSTQNPVAITMNGNKSIMAQFLTHPVSPQITCPSNINTNTAPGVCFRSVSFAANVSAGSPAPTVSYKLGGVTINSPYAFPRGTNVVTVTATNGVPPDANCSFMVIVADREPPTINCSTNITVTAAGACPQVVTFSQNISATDNCSLQSLLANPSSGAAFPVGTNVVNVTATDTAGNTNFCSFLVTVLPGPAPQLDIHRSDLAVVLSWPASNGCYQLQSTPVLIAPPGANVWATFSGLRATNGGYIFATNSAPTSNKFYRLHY